MADWFKFYENDLDETRLQYAISKMPEVVSVWVGISEACRHKTGTVSWGDDSIELFGFSRRLGLSMPKVNDGVNLLCEIRYISKKDGCINILKWSEKQSEYCRWKEKKTKPIKKSVHRVSIECPPRGEEKRIEENISSANGGEHKAFIDGWTENFKAQFGFDYAFDGGRDAKAVKDILKSGILRIDLLEIAKSAWKNQSNFACRQASTIHGFRNNLNPIRTELTNGHKNNSRPNPRNIGVVGDLAENSRKTAEFVKRQQAEREAQNEPV
jgi:hypothetical protein